MRFKIYVFMYMCLYFFDDSKNHENEKGIFIFFPYAFYMHLFSSGILVSEITCNRHDTGVYCDTQFYQITE